MLYNVVEKAGNCFVAFCCTVWPRFVCAAHQQQVRQPQDFTQYKFNVAKWNTPHHGPNNLIISRRTTRTCPEFIIHGRRKRNTKVFDVISKLKILLFWLHTDISRLLTLILHKWDLVIGPFGRLIASILGSSIR